MSADRLKAIVAAVWPRPPAEFNADFYLRAYPDVRRSGINPDYHWRRFGWAEGRIGSLPPDFFDPAYYLSCYGELIGEADPLAHFVDTGQRLGLKPNPDFDPLLYVLLHPEAKKNPLRHWLTQQNESVDPRVHSAFPDIPLPDWRSHHDQTQDLLERDLQNNLTHWRQFGDAQTLEFEVEGERYRLTAPSADDFFERLSKDRPFSFPRLPHAFWDCLDELYRIRAEVARRVPAGLFTEKQIDCLARRLCDEMLPEWGIYAENFLPELMEGIESELPQPDYWRSVSFKWRPTIDNRVFGVTEMIRQQELRKLRLFAASFGPGQELYESMVWKRWSYSGDMRRLPPLARERPVVLVGAAAVAALGNRWKLPWFEHLEIPQSSYTFRYEILARIKGAVLRAKATADARNTKRPLILLQGGSFAYWLIARLHQWDNSVFYFDLGQALHIWFIDNKKLWMAWLAFHPRLLMENCELDGFYDELRLKLEPPFVA